MRQIFKKKEEKSYKNKETTIFDLWKKIWLIKHGIFDAKSIIFKKNSKFIFTSKEKKFTSKFWNSWNVQLPIFKIKLKEKKKNFSIIPKFLSIFPRLACNFSSTSISQNLSKRLINISVRRNVTRIYFSNFVDNITYNYFNI